MTNAQLDAEKDRIDTAAWRELNTEDPAAKESVRIMLEAIEQIKSVENLLIDAAEKVENTPEFDRIESLRFDLEAFERYARKQVRRMGGRA